MTYHHPSVIYMMPRKSLITCVLIALFLAVVSCSQAARVKTEPDTPFVATPAPVVMEMLRMAGVTENDTVYDLGCGDGRVVVTAAARFHARAVGVEIDPLLVAKSRANAAAAGVSDLVTIVQQDIFRTDIRNASVVALYLLPGVNALLIPTLMEQLKPGSRVVSHMHDMGEWQPDKVSRIADSTIYLWIVPADVEGVWDMSITGFRSPVPGNLSIRQFFQFFRAAASLNGEKMRVIETSLKGSRITFSARQPGGEQSLFQGSVAGDTMEGTVTMTGGRDAGTYRWKAVKQKEKG